MGLLFHGNKLLQRSRCFSSVPCCWTLIVAALLTLLISNGSVAKSLTFDQKVAVGAVYYAMYAGLDDHCPRMKFNYTAGRAEFESVGIELDRIDNDPDVAEARHEVLLPVIVTYRRNPSALCSAAWSKFGPSGDYKRQLLEAK